MNIKIPPQTLLIIKRLTVKGDYKNIGKTEAGRVKVSRTIKKGEGDVKLVANIVSYYNKKQNARRRAVIKKAKAIKNAA
jgi:hypothetical protein